MTPLTNTEVRRTEILTYFNNLPAAAESAMAKQEALVAVADPRSSARPLTWRSSQGIAAFTWLGLGLGLGFGFG